MSNKSLFILFLIGIIINILSMILNIIFKEPAYIFNIILIIISGYFCYMYGRKMKK